MSGFDQMSKKRGIGAEGKLSASYKLQVEELVGLYGSPSHGKFLIWIFQTRLPIYYY